MGIGRTIVGQMVLLLGLAVPGQTEARVTVQVDDYVGLSQGMLDQAEEQVSRILQKAGIAIVWHSFVRSGTGAPLQTSRGRGLAGRPDVMLRIISRAMARRAGLDRPQSSFALGMALLGEEQRFGAVAYIYFHRFQQVAHFAQLCTPERATLLAHAMAHEIGHLLLNTAAHSPDGIMRAPWDKAQLEQAFCGQLVFTPAQADEMQTNLAAR